MWRFRWRISSQRDPGCKFNSLQLFGNFSVAIPVSCVCVNTARPVGRREPDEMTQVKQPRTVNPENKAHTKDDGP